MLLHLTLLVFLYYNNDLIWLKNGMEWIKWKFVTSSPQTQWWYGNISSQAHTYTHTHLVRFVELEIWFMYVFFWLASQMVWFGTNTQSPSSSSFFILPFLSFSLVSLFLFLLNKNGGGWIILKKKMKQINVHYYCRLNLFYSFDWKKGVKKNYSWL